MHQNARRVLVVALVVYVVLIVVAHAHVGAAEVRERRYEVDRKCDAEYAKAPRKTLLRHVTAGHPPAAPHPFWFSVVGAQWPVLGALVVTAAVLWRRKDEE